MAKKRKNNKDNEKKIESVGGLDGDLKHVVRVVSIIIIIFCLFYGLTLIITGNGISKKSNKQDSTDSSISYNDILLGRSFSMPEDEYLVLYYDKSDSDLLTSFATAISNYRNSEENYALYVVDMSNSFNNGYVSNESNTNPGNAQELAISGPTLIHFANSIVVEYIEGTDNILDYIK